MKVSWVILRSCGLVGFVVLLGINAGCALNASQKMALGQFSSSATKLGELTSSELMSMHDNTVKMTTERLLLGGKSKDGNLGDQRSLDRGFELKKVETISSATQALAAYGNSLSALVDDSQSANLKAASNQFVASLGNLPEVKSQINDKQLEAIGTVIQEVGGLWVEWKRKQAVTTIIMESQQAVDKLCDLLIRDFKSDEPDKGWVSLQLQVVEDPLMVEATNALYDGKTYNDRKIALEAFRLAYESHMRRTEVLERITGAAAAMKKANESLVNVISDSSWSIQDIKNFAEKAQSLQSAVKIIITK